MEHEIHPATEGVPAPSRRRWIRSARLAVLADPLPVATLALWLVAAAAWLLHSWEPVEDLAITELEVRRVGSDPPTRGPYSSLPLRHPGPALFYWLWPLYELTGRRPSALLAANLVLVGLTVAAVLALARRLSGRALQLALVVGLALWSSSNDGTLLLQPWNPFVAAAPTVLLVLLTWALVERLPLALPAAVVVGSWMVQAHIQFVPVVVGLWLLGGIALVVRTLRGREGGAGWRGPRGLKALARPLALAVLAGGLMWAPVAVDLVANGRQSNPAQIARHYLRGPEGDRLSSHSLEVMARSQLSLRPTWAGGPRSHPVYGLPGEAHAPWLVPIAGLAVLAAARRRAGAELRGMAVAAAGLTVSFWALSRVTGVFGDWYLIAVEGAGLTFAAMVAASLVATGRAVLRWVAARREAGTGARPDRVDRVLGGLGVAGALLVTALTVATLDHPIAERRSARAAAEVLPAVEAVVHDRPVLVEARSGFGGWVHSRLVLELERAGHDVYAKTTLADKYPADMEVAPPDDAVRLVVLSNPDADVRWSPGVEVVAETRYRTTPADERPLHVVVVTAPLGQIDLVEE